MLVGDNKNLNLVGAYNGTDTVLTPFCKIAALKSYIVSSRYYIVKVIKKNLI